SSFSPRSSIVTLSSFLSWLLTMNQAPSVLSTQKGLEVSSASTAGATADTTVLCTTPCTSVTTIGTSATCAGVTVTEGEAAAAGFAAADGFPGFAGVEGCSLTA